MLFGGKITLISPYEQKDLHPNIKIVKLEKVSMAVPSMKFLEMRNLSMIERIKYNIDLERDLTDFALSDTALFEVVKSGEKFDLFMFDAFFDDAMLGIAKYLNLPVIAVSSGGASRWSDEMVKNPVNPAYNPNLFLGFSDDMSFMERLKNSAMMLIDRLAYQ